MRTLWTGILVAVLAVLIVVPAAPAQSNVDAVKKQLQTTVFHAGELAQRGNAVAAAKTHLQHVMNCLEGAGGANFVAAAGYPCQGMGNGVVRDLQTAVAANVAGADRASRYVSVAWNLIVTALKSNDVDEVQPYAKVIAAQLKLALDSLP